MTTEVKPARKRALREIAEETPDINYELKMVLIDRVELKKLRQQVAAKDKAIAKKDGLLERASEALGRFCSDEGWGQEDMDTMDSIDAHLERRSK